MDSAAPVILTQDAPPPGMVGDPYDLLLQANNALGLAWAVEGDLPPCLQLQTDRITGTPTKTGAYACALSATADGKRGTKKITLQVSLKGKPPYWRERVAAALAEMK